MPANRPSAPSKAVSRTESGPARQSAPQARPYALKAPVASERDEQMALIRWARLQARQMPALRWLLAIPNGLAASSVGEAARMKAQGMQAGVPDLLLPVPCGGYAGLWIELKRREGGRLSAAQQDWLDGLNILGYRAVCCAGWDAAREALVNYLTNGGE